MAKKELTEEEKAAKKKAFSEMCRQRQLGKKHTEESKRKIGEASKKQRHTEETKERMRDRGKQGGE